MKIKVTGERKLYSALNRIIQGEAAERALAKALWQESQEANRYVAASVAYSSLLYRLSEHLVHPGK